MTRLKFTVLDIYSEILSEYTENHSLFQNQWDLCSFCSTKNMAYCILLTVSFKVAFNSSSTLATLHIDKALNVLVLQMIHDCPDQSL